MNATELAAARSRLLIVVAEMLEVLYGSSVVRVLSTLKPMEMKPGGARVPGTSYELSAEVAARTMRELLALSGDHADELLKTLATADIAAREATLVGKPPPALSNLYPHCVAAENITLHDAAVRLYRAAEKILSLTQLQRIDEQLLRWLEVPEEMDATPVQQFVARFVRNAPP